MALVAFALVACAGCAGDEETFDTEDVRRAFQSQGIALWASGADGYVNLVPYDPVPRVVARPAPMFYVGVFDDADEARRVVSGDADWEVVVLSVSYPEDPLVGGAPPDFESRRLRRARNVVIEYDAADRPLARRIAAALRALDDGPG